MRLTDNQRTLTVVGILGAGSQVWLFGSRVSDIKRGGDIDLLVKTTQTIIGIWKIIDGK